MSLLEQARKYYDSGLNVLPAIRSQKRPVGAWKRFSLARPAFEEAFPQNLQFDALALVCGATSGGLEIVDFDQKALLFGAFCKLWARAGEMVVESTRSGGKHLGYRVANALKNTKLARVGDGVAIETRGTGGICIVAPTEGYRIETPRDWSDLPTLSTDERDRVFELARSLDQTPRASKKAPALVLSNALTGSVGRQAAPAAGNCESVADYMKRIAAGREALLRAGWTYLRTQDGFEQYARPNQPVPGKTGLSYNVEERYYHCFTTNGAPLEVDRTYSDLQLVAALEFDGDVSACATEYGKRSGSAPVSHVVRVVLPDRTKSEKNAAASAGKTKKIEPPQSLFECGGLVQELFDLAMDYAIRPQPAGSLLGALTSMSYVCGRAIEVNLSGVPIAPNLFSLFLAPSGMGKEAIRRVASAVISAYNPNEVAPESFASVQALQNLIVRVKKIFWLHDEFGRDLAVMNGKTTNANTSSIITECLKLYTNSSNRRYKAKVVAQEAKGVKPVEFVDRPSLSIFATGNPSEFFDAVSGGLFKSGYLSRFSIVAAPDYVGKRAIGYEDACDKPVFKLPARVVQIIRNWRKTEQYLDGGSIVVPFDPDAYELIAEFDRANERALEDAIKRNGDGNELRTRLFEKAWKYALLFSASRFGPAPVLKVDAFAARLAVDFARYEAALFDTIVGKAGLSESGKIEQEILEYARRVRFFTKSEFTVGFQKYEHRQRYEALRTLLDSEFLVQTEIARDGKVKKGYAIVES